MTTKPKPKPAILDVVRTGAERYHATLSSPVHVGPAEGQRTVHHLLEEVIRAVEGSGAEAVIVTALDSHDGCPKRSARIRKVVADALEGSGIKVAEDATRKEG